MVSLTQAEISLANETSFWCAKEKGNTPYCKGFVDAVSVGTKGEIAFGKLISQPVDLQYKINGSKHDFVFRGKSIDVKTCSRKSVYNYIRVVNEYGKNIPLKSDIYVGAFLDSNAVVFTGWNTKEDLLCFPKEKSTKSTHLNIRMDVYNSRKIKEFIDNFFTKGEGL